MDRKFFSKSAGISLLVAIALFGIFLIVSGTEVSAAVPWHSPSLTQAQRNAKILAQANADLNGSANGYNCKIYVAKLVQKVSGNLAALPQTNSNNYSWDIKPSSDATLVYTTGPMSPAQWIGGLKPGQIIQMQDVQSVKDPKTGKVTYFYGPHTAIVVSQNSSGVTVIDSNCRTYAPTKSSVNKSFVAC